MVLKISPSPKQSLAPSSCGMRPAGRRVFSKQAGHSTRIILKLWHADRTRPLSVNLMQPSGAIARKMLSKGFGNK